MALIAITKLFLINQASASAQKTIFFFQMFWKYDLSKKIALEYDLSCIIRYQESWYFFFPKISSYSLDGKWKMIFLKKYMEIRYFLQMARKHGLSKKITLEYDPSYISEKMVFFFLENMIFFLSTENERWSFSRNTWRYDIFCIYV